MYDQNKGFKTSNTKHGYITSGGSGRTFVSVCTSPLDIVTERSNFMNGYFKPQSTRRALNRSRKKKKWSGTPLIFNRRKQDQLRRIKITEFYEKVIEYDG